MNKSKNIAVLGGSFLQQEFVLTAHSKGHNIFIFDGNPNCYLSRNKDYKFVNINFSNENEVLQFCKKNDISFVYAPSNEAGNLIASRLASKIGYKYNSEETVFNTLNKSSQRKLLNKLNQIKSPKSTTFQDDIKRIESNLKYPLIVKPSSSSASRGISSADNQSELINAVNTAKQFLKPGDDIIVEEYIEGEQISVETISADGKHYIAGITLEIVSGAPDFVERSHFMGPGIHERFFDLLVNPINELLNKANIKVGPCHIELKVKNNEIYLIEIASRAGGLRDYLMKVSGYPDFNELILDAYLNNTIKQENLHTPEQNGLVNIFTKVNDLHTFVKGRKDGTLVNYYFNEKGPVPEPKNLIDAYGYAYFKSTKSLIKYALK